jgi:thiol-disulfide isomerase/thioredoxin
MQAKRRQLLAAGAALALPGIAAAQVAAPTRARARPMTAAEESAAALAVAESIADQTGDPVHPAVGRMPKLQRSLRTLDGGTYGEERARGKLLLLYYWASWCPICKVVSPRVHEFWRRNRSRGVEVLALSTDNAITPAVASLEHSGFRYPAAMAASAGFDSYMVARSLPTLMVRSRRGVIVSVDEGDVEADELQDYLVHL